MKGADSSTKNGTGSHGNSSKEAPTSVPVYHVTFPGTFIEVSVAQQQGLNYVMDSYR